MYRDHSATAVYSANPDDLTTCAGLVQLQSIGNFLPGTQFYLNSIWGAVAQVDDGTGVRFNTVHTGYRWYLTATNPLRDYSPYKWCNKTTNPDNPYHEGDSVDLVNGMQADFLVGFGPRYPWLQVTGGGNTYGTTIQSLMPLMSTSTLLFDTTTSPTSPGIVSVPTSGTIDFSDSWASAGKNNISSTNWSTNNAMTAKDWYEFFSARLAQAPQEDIGPGKPVWNPPPGTTYKVYTTANNADKNLTINEPWTIADGEKLIVIVDGYLHIDNPITIGNGFIAFIVKDDIIIHPSVGSLCNATVCTDETPDVEGMYIANGNIKTGVSIAGTERFVGKGMFIGNEILTQRNVGPVLNKTLSSDLFIYNPAFLITMPDILKDLSYQWQEVAP